MKEDTEQPLFSSNFTMRKLGISDEIKLFDFKQELKKYQQMLYYKQDMIKRKLEIGGHSKSLIEDESHIKEIQIKITNCENEILNLETYSFILNNNALEKINELKTQGKIFEADYLSAVYISQAVPNRSIEIFNILKKKYVCLQCACKDPKKIKSLSGAYGSNGYSLDYKGKVYENPKNKGTECTKCGHIEYGDTFAQGFFNRASFSKNKSDDTSCDNNTLNNNNKRRKFSQQ